MIEGSLPRSVVQAADCLPASTPNWAIMGAIMLDNRAYSQTAGHLSPRDFSLDSNRRIYSRLVDLAESLRQIDMVTLIEELDRHKELQVIGGAAYVSSHVEGLPARRNSRQP